MKKNIFHIHIQTALIFFYALTTTVAVKAQGFDYDILCGLQQRRTPAMDNVMVWTSNSLVLAPAVPAATWVATAITPDNTQLKQVATATTISFGTAFAITEVVKHTVRRPRPYDGYAGDLIPVKRTIGYSFPSGHTSLTFSVATSLSLSYPKWYVVAPSMLWASGVAFSRLYLGVHYPTDVFTGMIVGVTSGFFGHWLTKRLYDQSDLPAPKLMTMPIVIRF